jgi:hypothetical protein
MGVFESWRRWRAWARGRRRPDARAAEPRPTGFEEYFEDAVRSGAAAPPPPPSPWDDVFAANGSKTPLRVRCFEREANGLRVTYRGLEGRLLLDGAPWNEANAPEEADAWVLKFDRDAGELVFIAWDPSAGPQGREP